MRGDLGGCGGVVVLCFPRERTEVEEKKVGWVPGGCRWAETGLPPPSVFGFKSFSFFCRKEKRRKKKRFLGSKIYGDDFISSLLKCPSVQMLVFEKKNQNVLNI